jgi:hypothetical protein
MSEQTEEQLLQKIAQLESQYEAAHQARLEAERRLAGHVNSVGSLPHIPSLQVISVTIVSVKERKCEEVFCV